MRECYYNKFVGDQCQKPAVYEGRGANNYTDGWTWCEEHAPGLEYREVLKEESIDELSS